MAVACLNFFIHKNFTKQKHFCFLFSRSRGTWLCSGCSWERPALRSVSCFVFVFDLPRLPPYCMGWGCLAPLGSRHHITSVFPCFCICPHAPSSAYVRMLHPLLQIVLVPRDSTPAYLSGAVGVWALFQKRMTQGLVGISRPGVPCHTNPSVK